jgi:hypothetical protein
VARLVQDIYRAIYEDPQLRFRFRLRHRGACRDPAPFAGQLAWLLAEVLLRAEGAAPASFVRYLRQFRLTGEDYDRFAHYLLTVVLAHRVGPGRLLRVGTALTDIREAVLDPGRRAGVTRPAEDLPAR